MRGAPDRLSRPGRLAVSVLPALILLIACATPPEPYPQLRIPEAEFRRQVETICLAEIEIQVAYDGVEERLRAFEGLIAGHLRSAGYSVVESSRTSAVSDRVARDAGGYFDPHTGARSEPRYRAIRAETARALGQELGCDAVLEPVVAHVLARWVGGVAGWDGAREEIEPGRRGFGDVPALSLWVFVVDPEGKEIYFGTGGIQVMAMPGRDGHGTGRRTPSERILADARTNQHAVAVALRGITSIAAAKP